MATIASGIVSRKWLERRVSAVVSAESGYRGLPEEGYAVLMLLFRSGNRADS
jgi:hypothetical protein